MKFTRLAFLTAVATAALMAQGGWQRGGNGRGTPPDPAAMAQNRVNRLKTLLNLTDAQVTQATTIFTNAASSAASLRTGQSQAHQSLRDAIKTNNINLIDQLSSQIGTSTGQLMGIQTKAEAAFYALLTADQKAKYDELGGGMRGPGGMGPMGSGDGMGMGRSGRGR